jgi:hypothetical protein
MGVQKEITFCFSAPGLVKPFILFYKPININDNKKPLISFTDFSFLRFDFKLNNIYICILGGDSSEKHLVIVKNENN